METSSPQTRQPQTAFSNAAFLMTLSSS